MSAIDAEIRRSATFQVDRQRIWEELCDVSQLDRLIPDVDGYEQVEHGWLWQLEARRIMGYRIQPRFTVTYVLSPPNELRFEHVSGERGDTADSHGAFRLREVDGGTEVTVELAVRLDVVLPSLFQGGVRELLREEVREMADGFLANLRSAVGS